MPGTLFVVATPIGNLEDLTFRAARVLREVDLIAAEDTRRTARLLAHYEIAKPLTSLREHNEHAEIPKLVARLGGGTSVALVTDAGTPGIADPGAHLVRAARAAAIRVVPIPGASAVTTVLSAAGFPADQFVFLGFPPSSGPKRDDWLLQVGTEPRLQIFFEAPHRIARTLRDARAALGGRPIIVGRELTKLHEELVEWPTNGGALRDQGEFAIVVGPLVQGQKAAHTQQDEVTAAALFDVLTQSAHIDEELARKMVAGALGWPPGLAAKRIKRGKIAARQRSDPPS
jgi:16S rRNA (cytidine1402-2'-O)-methyltransferase